MVPEVVPGTRERNDPLVTEADQLSVPPPLFDTLIDWPRGPPPPATAEKAIAAGVALIVGVAGGATVKLTGMSRGVFVAPLALIRMLPLKVPPLSALESTNTWKLPLLVPEVVPTRERNDPLVTDADQVRVPPPLFDTLIVWLTGLPPPAGPPEKDSDAGVTLIVGVAAATVIDSVFEAVFCGLLLSVTVTVKLNVPATVGVPKTAPEEELIPMPLGRPEADQL